MKSGGWLVWSVLGAVALASPAVAQERRAKITAEIRAVADDNISRSNSTVAARRGVVREDWQLIPSLNIDYAQPFGRQLVTLGGSVGYTFYEKNDQLNKERINLQGGVSTRVGPCNGGVTGEFRRAQSDLRDLTELTVTQNVETVTSVALNTVCGRPTGFGVSVGVNQKWMDNSAAARAMINYDSTNGLFGVVYQRPTLGTITLFGGMGETRYGDRPIIGGGGANNSYQNYSGGISYTRRLGARLQGSVSAGYSYVDPKRVGTRSYSGFTYNANIDFKPSNRLQANLNLSRGAQPSNRMQATYSISEGYAASVNYSIGSRIRASVGGSYNENSYEGSTIIPGLRVTEEQVRSLYASLGVNLGRRVAMSVDARQEERDANLNGFDYTANRIGLTLSAAY